MPELPEVETVVRSLAPRLPGRTIVRAEFRSRFVVPQGFEPLRAAVEGRTVQGIARRAKFILLSLDDGMLSIHLGMTGKLLMNAAETPYTRAVFHLDRGVLLFDDVRQFGKIEWAPALPARVARLGPEPLSIRFEEFFASLRRRRARLKPLLLNQAFLGGVGNIYADEALFQARIHPLAMSSRLSRQRALRLHAAIVKILEQAIAHHGSSISDYVDAEGQPGSFQLLHQVYGRGGEPCRICGTPVRRIVVSQRGTHYCPKCQRA